MSVWPVSYTHLVVTAYSIMGGLWSVTLTDFVQVFLIVIGMIIAIPFALNYAGGWSSVTANIEPGTLSMFKGCLLYTSYPFSIYCQICKWKIPL